MHLLPRDERTLDGEAQAIDLEQTPAELVVLSFSDGDLAAVAAAHGAASAHERARLPSLRLANLARLKHPYSVDLYLEKVVSKTRFVLVRLLGGFDYWRYGVEELAAAARRHGLHLAIVPGCDRADPRLDEASTLPEPDLRRLWTYFREGGPENCGQALRFIADRMGRTQDWVEPRPLAAAGLHPPFCRPNDATAPHVLITFYRSALLAADTVPIAALADALSRRGARVSAFFVTSLKDEAAASALAEALARDPPDVVLNTTAFSARREERAARQMDDGVTGFRVAEGKTTPCKFSDADQDGGERHGAGTVLDAADVPVLQIVLSGFTRDAWASSRRGLGSVDLAMNVVLPEVDGRILAGVLSFKHQGETDEAFEFATVSHRPEPSRVAHAADLALAWARLGAKPRCERRIACVLSDYPGKGGRAGFAVGLDTPASVATIAAVLAAADYDVPALPDGPALMAALTEGPPARILSLADYRRGLARLPKAFVAGIEAAWGAPADDPAVVDGAFAFPILRSGKLIVALQPDRGRAATRRADYHDAALPPRHGYVAFYLWLREIACIDAMVHLGTHGTLEWLPGKAVALGEACAPEAVLGAVPVIYPFICNNPGEAAQAKRRIAAVTIGHLTPPLVAAGTHGALGALEALFDEFAEADGLDPRRARLLSAAILDHARDTGLAADCGLKPDEEAGEALMRLDAWLCDVKEARIGDGLHVFGAWDADDACLERAACGGAERAGLIAALDGRFVIPGPAGSPAQGRRDVLPTGRNLYTVDPRAVPTRTAYEIGSRAAAEFLTRHAQDHGEWPRRIVLDLWGSATMRTGGDDLAQAFALLGTRPLWDAGSTRVSGFEILPLARLARPRVDVTLRISGLFRDTFPGQIALFDAACRAVALLDEAAGDNPLAEARRADGAAAPGSRVFGAAPHAYGAGIGDALASGQWESRAALGQAYLDATSHAYGGPDAEGRGAGAEFRARVASADAHLHMQDLPETDLLASSTVAEHQGGFAAAAALLGSNPALYHGDGTREGAATIRGLTEEIARVVRARATNPRWITGQMRHGFRGVAEIAETLDGLFAYAATTQAVPSRHFDLLFDATFGDAGVRAFLAGANPAAARAMADRFEEAARRGFWVSRRNSTAAILAELRSPA